MSELIQQKIDELHWRKRLIEQGGGDDRIAAQRDRGKQTARERLALLLDSGSFVELNSFVTGRSTSLACEYGEAPGEGVVTGYGKINKRLVFVFAQDFTVFGGALGEMHAKKIAAIMDLAGKTGAPLIGLNDSGGARIQEGVAALDGYGQIFYRNVRYSGLIPQISVILGPCAGGAVYSPALTDFLLMVEHTSQMFITGPKVTETVTGEKISSEELGGARVHAALSGNVHFTAATENDVFYQLRQLLSYLPQNCREMPPVLPYDGPERDWIEELIETVPAVGTKAYDVKKLLQLIVDYGDFLEVQAEFAKNVVVGFGRINGHSVGIVANQPKYMAGGLDIDASDKLSRFVRTCDCFNIPLITFVDVPGFYPGLVQEHGGLIRHGAKILYAYAEATVPKISVITRKAYGGAFVALNSKAMGADLVFAWPQAEMAVMGPEAAVAIIYAKQIRQSAEPKQTRLDKISEYRRRFANPYVAAGYGMVDEVIDPRATRLHLKRSLELLQQKQEQRPTKKHGNIPL
ncbi:acyl-CoA carboxylase subunit beta [Brevibacillus fulvus]|uniref:Propionyl-CoA carboxylase beta chain n=1 Tax=Brevibacillus fulvus TaxID=1125967 RepID=A0A939BTM7_9BACL|nr:acyl-CoA carboxylase subunit beta [Brevibacillus fulvus]MBM7588616.1 propionyl-CoA carboxylase beta chain [Brevibacillus fulvus]